MDLIYTNAQRIDQGVLSAYAFDLSFGADENDFEITLGADEPLLEIGAFVYIEGTEYGGIIDGILTSTNGSTITYKGRTWHGILNSKVIQPDSGADYLILSGDLNVLLGVLIDRLGLGDLFVANADASDISITNHKVNRYCKAYDGIRSMLDDKGAKLQVKWEGRTVHLGAVPIVDYRDYPIDGDIANLEIERYGKKVNHLICLGQGNLAAREVIHLYVDQFGRIGDVQYFTGIDEVVDTYENVNVESADELRTEGIERLKELRDNDTAEISLPEDETMIYDIGDIVGAMDVQTGNTVTAAVIQKIVKIKNGVIRTDYKTRGE